MFGGLGIQVQPDGYSVSNIFEGSFNEEVMIAGKAVSEKEFKFATSDARNKLDIMASACRGAIGV